MGSDPPTLPNRVDARSAPAPELQYRALSACHAAEKAGTTFGLLCFDVLEAYGHTKDTLPRAWLNAWVKCQQPAGKALGVKGPIAGCLMLGTMALFLLYTSRCQHVQSASSEPHVASQECSSICPNLKPVPARYLSGWLGALVPSSPLQPYLVAVEVNARTHSSTDAPVSALGRPGTGGVGGLRKVSQRGTCQSHWARMLALTVLSRYHQTLERGAVQ